MGGSLFLCGYFRGALPRDVLSLCADAAHTKREPRLTALKSMCYAQTHLACAFDIHLVEMRRIELLSEDNVTWISPSAVCAFI